MANSQQLKGDIDAGKTGDKIPQGFDPGLSTLGTDDEASGNTPTAHEVALARQSQGVGAARQPEEQGSNSRTPSGRPTPWIIGALVVVVVVVVVAALVMGRL